MLVFEIVIALLLAGAVLTVVSRRIGAPYPALVALAGAALALVPGTPTLVLDPELALALFVAPTLMDSAFDSSPRDLRANIRIVTGLAIGAVILTIAAVAAVVRLAVPEMPWAAAIALGAIVAPPDAAAATAVLKQLHPPHRLLVILEGESLFNDASALLVYRLAIAATLAGSLTPASVIPSLFVVTLGSAALGFVLSRVLTPLLRMMEEVTVVVVVQFCGTFAAWLIAERLHLSGILTMVVFAMTTARRVAETTPARIRVPSYAVWDFAVFVLNVLAFILVGFQLKAILGRIDRATLFDYGGIALAVCGTVIAARVTWVTAAASFSRWWRRSNRTMSGWHDRSTISKGDAALIAWCGMRGIVTLAAALALPAGSAAEPAFPFRDLILFTAFSVVLGTLVVQGLTLRPLLGLLRLEDEGVVARETRFARLETIRAALAAVADLPGEISGLLRRRYEMMLRRAEAPVREVGSPTHEPQSTTIQASDDAACVQKALSAERQKLVALRADGTIGDTAFQRVEQQLDLEELYLQEVILAADASPTS